MTAEEYRNYLETDDKSRSDMDKLEQAYQKKIG